MAQVCVCGVVELSTSIFASCLTDMMNSAGSGWELRGSLDRLGFVLTTSPWVGHTEHYTPWKPPIGRWTHVAVTYSSDGRTLELFHDCQLLARFGLEPRTLVAATGNQLGVGMNTSWSNRRVPYQFHSVRITARVLAPAEFLPSPGNKA